MRRARHPRSRGVAGLSSAMIVIEPIALTLTRLYELQSRHDEAEESFA